MIDYKKKYLKYKIKYLNLKENQEQSQTGGTKQTGGLKPMVQVLDEILGNTKMSNNDLLTCLKQHLNSKEHTYKDQTMTPNKHLVIVIYAPWCGHCVDFITNEGKTIVDSEDSGNIKFLDGTSIKDNKELAGMLKVDGFPTIYKIDTKSTIDNMIKKEHVGGRKAQDILKILN